MSIAFVFSGEAARGAFQAGIARELASVGVFADEVYGTSSGAINAMGYSYLGPEKLALKWKDIDSIKKVFKSNGLSSLWRSGVYNAQPLHDLIYDIASKNVWQIPVTVSRVNLHTGELQYVRNVKSYPAEFSNAVVSSAAIPGVVEPILGTWVDGGIRTQAPLKRAIEDGHDEIFVIVATPQDLPHKKSIYRNNNAFPWGLGKSLCVAMRSLEILIHNALMSDIRTALKKNKKEGYRKIKIRVIGPKEYLYSSFEFDKVEYGLSMSKAYFTDYDLEKILEV